MDGRDMSRYQEEAGSHRRLIYAGRYVWSVHIHNVYPTMHSNQANDLYTLVLYLVARQRCLGLQLPPRS